MTTTAGYWKQVKLSFWKTFLVRRRKPVRCSWDHAILVP